MSAMRSAVETDEWQMIFVDDGSNDGTGALLSRLKEEFPSRVSVLHLEKNSGKGEAVRTGMLAALERGAEVVAYLDADLATPFAELSRLRHRLLEDPDLDVVLGSRVLLLGSDIRRSLARHLRGRVYATLASLALGVGVYDTQCGAKIFRATGRLDEALARPFADRWSFDVELLSRLSKGSQGDSWDSMVEVPLLTWHDHLDSKVHLLAALRASAEVIRIAYRRRR